MKEFLQKNLKKYKNQFIEARAVFKAGDEFLQYQKEQIKKLNKDFNK